ncbi:hypothetical protein [Streptacidiphilus jiangxiensis]|uniref:HEAT repeat domain-containing protein n=1 Tax=Streptacidiphilus jiangxiensis TaxID=235985 RepID=A0A1H7N5T9_STRJI|nr:hypothetical protein [Streptacidiphilus jiangxiensis]SEL18784.1 hypothetical protein SAMN05414137_106221 [Streptacidiphilus jiangxiensis]
MQRLDDRELQGLQSTVRSTTSPTERQEAARLLGTLSEEEQEIVTDGFLADDFPLSVASDIAQGMSGLARRFRERLADRLRGPAAASGPFEEDRIWAAEALAALGPEYRDEAVALLRAAIADPQQGRWESYRVAQLRWMAAVMLAEIDPALREEAAAVVHGNDIANESRENGLARAVHLREIGGAPAEEGTNMLLEALEHLDGDDDFRYDVEEALGLHDADQAEAAAVAEGARRALELTQEQADLRSALMELDALGLPNLVERYESGLAGASPDQAEALSGRYRDYVARATAADARAALTMSVDESAAVLRARLPEGSRDGIFVAWTDAAEPLLGDPALAAERKIVAGVWQELELSPYFGWHRPHRGERDEDYVVEIEALPEIGRRAVTLVYRHHPELRAVLLLWVLLGP